MTIAASESWIAVVTAVVAVVGAVWGFVVWMADRAKDRRLRLEASFDQNVQRIVGFPSADRPSDASVNTAIANLVALIDEAAQRRRAVLTGRVTDAITTVVENDLDFEVLTHARASLSCLVGWSPWRDRLADEPKRRDWLLYRYQRGLRFVHDQDPTYFESITRDTAGVYDVPSYTDEKVYLLFERLTAGYEELVGLVSGDDERREAVEGFAEATGNPDLARNIFERSATPADTAPERTSTSAAERGE